MTDCLFCQIVDKKIKAKIIYQDKFLLAFYDINPKAKHHVLIIPKEHIVFNNYEEKMPNLPVKILKAAKKIAKDLKIETDGFRLVINNGPLSGQEIDHIHCHLLGGNHLGPVA